ncbi:glycosyltransferase involved in cell wall biosynthesis [Bradyrhizobium japonicum]|uniref:glycosyltransferase family 2 protein n=1 Tax=Bradyrhizobium japonicum TaxID=375 RepID=UPI0033983F5F
MKKRISLLLPTRGRPDLVKRFLRSVVAQSTCPELIEVILRVDDDDIDSHGIVFDGLALKLVIGPRQTMGAYNAECLRHASGEITIAVNDDIIIQTRGWDEKVRELDASYPDGVYLGYGNDLFKGPELCTFPILSQRTCSVLAEPYPGIYKGAFIDVHLMDIFRRLEKRGYARICYAADIVFEHVHYRNNPDALDATYTDRSRFGDDLTFIALAGARRLEANRLLALVSGGSPERRCSPQQSAVKRTSLIGIWPLCARKFLLDFDLPLSWRTYLFAWMVARYYFSRIRRTP